MKKCVLKGLIFLASFLIALPSGAQVLLFDNGPFVTNVGAGSGGADISTVQSVTFTGYSTFGYTVNNNLPVRLTDQFTNTFPWKIDYIDVYAYQTGSTTTSTFTSGVVKIWDADPSTGTANTEFGDFTTNRMTLTDFTNCYRVQEGANSGTTRPIMRIRLNLGGVVIPAGTHWVEWGLTGTLASGPFAPAVSILGTPTTGDAKQFNVSSYTATLVSGSTSFTIGIPFKVFGSDFGVTSITPNSVCAGSSITVEYTDGIVRNPGNTYTLELSDASGNFPGTLLTTTVVSPTQLSATVPLGSTGSLNYNVRVVASDPAANSISQTLAVNNNSGTTNEPACDSYTWNSNTYTSTGVYTGTFTNQSGCDSVHTLNLTVNYSNTGSSSETACDSYLWNGTTYTVSGAPTHNYTNQYGCDSVHTLNLTINYSNTGSSSETACNSYVWNGTTYTASGAPTHTYTNQDGCDSVHTLNLIVHYSNNGSSSDMGCDSYTWGGSTYTTSGNYTHTFSNIDGCDSVHTLTLTVDYSSLNCGGDIAVSNDPDVCGAIVNFTMPTYSLCAPPCSAPTSIPGYTSVGTFNGHKYFLSNTAADWQVAKNAAISLGGHLVTITSGAENTFVNIACFTYPNTLAPVWLGASDSVSEGNYQWVTGEPFTFVNWRSGEPNGGVFENYIYIYPDETWNDASTVIPRKYLVEFECSNSSNVIQTAGLASGSLFPVGTTTNTFEITDANNVTYSCSFNVVVADTQHPVITTQNITVNNTPGTCGKNIIYCDDVLYAVSGSGNATSVLYKLNPATGAVISTIGSTGYNHITGLAVNPLTGVIYAHANAQPSFGQGKLLTLNPTTGAATFVANTTLQSPDMTFSPSGVLYAWYEYNGTTNQSDGLCTIDLTTGAVTQVGSSYQGTLQTGLAFNPSGQLFLKVGGDEIRELDPTTGADISYLVLSGSAQNMLAFNSSGVAFTGSRSGIFTLKNINLSTGTISNIGTNSVGTISAITFGISCNVTVSDNCATPTVTFNPPSGTLFSIGTTTVTATATDNAGNTATSQFTVTVLDNQFPTILCPSDLTVNTDDQTGCFYTASIGIPTYSDNCTVSLSGPVPAGPYPLGATQVTWTATDSSGNVSTCTQNIMVNSSYVVLNAKAILAGPYNSVTGLMHDSLRVRGLIPSVEPYSGGVYNLPTIGEPGGETVSTPVLAVTGNDAIVDWVYLELRSASSPSTIVATKRALIQRDGDIVSATDGVSPVAFATTPNGSYYVSLKHRNHLGVMTIAAVNMTSCNSAPLVDFTTPGSVHVKPSIATTPRKLMGGIYALWSGDANTNKNVKYNGLSNDKDMILNAIGGVSNPNNTLQPVYRREDLNMDGKIRYNNTDMDRGVIIDNVGPTTPNTIINQHTPN